MHDIAWSRGKSRLTVTYLTCPGRNALPNVLVRGRGWTTVMIGVPVHRAGTRNRAWSARRSVLDTAKSARTRTACRTDARWCVGVWMVMICSLIRVPFVVRTPHGPSRRVARSRCQSSSLLSTCQLRICIQRNSTAPCVSTEWVMARERAYSSRSGTTKTPPSNNHRCCFA